MILKFLSKAFERIAGAVKPSQKMKEKEQVVEGRSRGEKMEYWWAVRQALGLAWGYTDFVARYPYMPFQFK